MVQVLMDIMLELSCWKREMRTCSGATGRQVSIHSHKAVHDGIGTPRLSLHALRSMALTFRNPSLIKFITR
jgi:hypothetical protein